MTDAELIAAYVEHMAWRRLSPNTIDIRQTYLRKLSRELGPLSKIKVKHLRTWLADPERNLDASSQTTLLSTYHAFYTWAVGNRKLKKDPTAKIDKPKAKKGEPHPITEESLEKSLANANGLMRCWLLLGAYEGLRCQEIALMSRQDVQEDSMRLYVAHGKGNKTRWLPLDQRVWEALNGWGMAPSGRLWDISPPEMSKALCAHLRENGAVRVDGEPATAHSLRHRFASRMYQLTKDLRLVQTLMGHESPSTTAGYAACDTSGAAERMGKL